MYVGKATNLRARVRSYFSSDDRRKIGPMLREMQSIDHVVCRSTLEAGVLESRLIAQLLPRYNRRGTRWKKYVYLKLTAEPWTVEEDDRARLRRVGFSDRDIWDIAAVAAFYNMTNRLASATDMRPNSQYHGQAR